MDQEGKWLEQCILGIILLERSIILVQNWSKIFSWSANDSRGVAQPGSATVLGTVGREFESRRPDHLKNLLITIDICAQTGSADGTYRLEMMSIKKFFFFFKIFIDQRVFFRASCMSGVININMWYTEATNRLL